MQGKMYYNTKNFFIVGAVFILTNIITRSRQIEIEDGSAGEDTIAPLSKDNFCRPPNVTIRDWISKLVGKWLWRELSQ